MARKRLVMMAVLILACSSLSAWVAYRRGVARRGYRSTASFAPDDAKRPCVDFRHATDHIGETTCVSARVGRVFTSRSGNTFLDFCADYRACPFTSVIFSDDRGKFGNLQALAGRRLEIEGPITTYQGRAEIIIHNSEQVRVLP